jgi:NitT/TauT family transport system ATP-binding protein
MPTAPHESGAVLAFTGVSKVFPDGTRALAALDLHVGPGEFVSVVGPSGCGKTTVLRLASGLNAPTGGTIVLRSDRTAYVFQDATLLPWRGALANVELVLELSRLPKARRRDRARHALEIVGLAGFEEKLPAQLSGGMRMRVSLARALVLEPELFLFDEPFGALDEITRLRMQEELQRLIRDGGYSALFITHSVPEAVYLSDRVLVLSSRPGRVVADIRVPFDYPRAPELRFDPEFSRIAARVSHSLGAAMTGAGQ